MAYETTNQPAMLADRIGGGGAVWSYISEDALSAVVAANYFADGEVLGMKTGDQVNVVTTGDTPVMNICYVSDVTDAGATVIQASAAEAS